MALNRRQLKLIASFMLLHFLQTSNMLNLQLVCLLSSLHRVRQLQASAMLAFERFEQQSTKRKRQKRLQNSRRSTVWALPRPTECWFDTHYHDWSIPEDYFRDELRMNRRTFSLLLEVLGPRLTRRNTRMRNCVPAEKILAMALKRLGSGAPYLDIAPSFCVGRSTVLEATQDVVNALCDIKNDYIKFPETATEIRKCRETFERSTNLPNVVGALGASHVEIKNATASAEYVSRFQRRDVVAQGVVDGHGQFLDFSAGYPGSMDDTSVLKNSRLFARIQNEEILTKPVPNTTDGLLIDPFLVGSRTYPLARWLQKPFSGISHDAMEIRYNREIVATHVQIQCAFGNLKSRWGITKRIESKISFVSNIILACAVLHNFCLGVGDSWEENDAFDDTGSGDTSGKVIGNGEEVREAIKDYVCGL